MGKDLEKRQICEDLCEEGLEECVYDGGKTRSKRPKHSYTITEKGSIEKCHEKLREKGKLGETKMIEAVRDGKTIDLWVKA